MGIKLAPPSEAQIENQILLYLNAIHVFARKYSTGGYYDASLKRFRKQASPFHCKGAPDIIAIVPVVIKNIEVGVYVGLEVKSAVGRLSDSQKLFQADVMKAKGFYFIVRSVMDAQQAIKSVKDSIQIN